MANLFNKAKASAPAKTTKAKDEKVRVTVADPDFFNKVDRLSTLNDNMKREKAEADMIHDEVKDLGKTEWTKLYQKTGKNPGTIVLEAKNGLDIAQLQFVPSDKYITINKDRAESLVETYGEDIVEENTTFAFDNAMIEKYGEVLSRLIEESDEIADDDKEKIIKAVTSFSVAKGTIDKMKTYGDVDMIIEEVKPVISLKNVEVIKG
jgi:hypothetical protein